MKKNQRYLVVIRPPQHEGGKGLGEIERAAIIDCCERVKKYLGRSRKVVFSATTACAMETALLVSHSFNKGMFVFTEALQSDAKHHTRAKDKKELRRFLLSHQAEFDVLVVVTHIGHDHEDETFLMSNLEGWLGWQTISSACIGCALVIEYAV